MVASYSELYEEGEVDHINGVWPDFLLKTANFTAFNDKVELRPWAWSICFESLEGENSTPSTLKVLNLRSSDDKSADLEGRVRAKSMTVFHVMCFKDKVSFLPNECRWSNTTCTSHVLEYFGKGGLSLKAPFSSLVTRGCCPTLRPSTFSCTDEMAER